MNRFTVIIPARYASQRLPGKPLQDILGKPMIQRVYEQASASAARQVVVATDDSRIAEAVRGFGGSVCMTRDDHQSGTDRLAEVVAQLALPDTEIVVNVQGDEPLIPPRIINQVALNLLNANVPMATLAEPIHDAAQVFNANVVKVVRDRRDLALYFSRAPIPWSRELYKMEGVDRLPVQPQVLRHIGLYAYTARFLREFVQWEPCDLERVESLEQLRVLWQGQSIHVGLAEEVPPPGVDTLADLEAVRRLLQKRLSGG
jgi:3-deoxy-manno-octulosonate cytidylyltransferase (CMP-KDO synthetase)